MQVSYFKTVDGGFIAVTDECPKGFKNLVFVGKGPVIGGGAESVREQGYAPGDLTKLQRVNAADVSAEWMVAFGYELPATKPANDPLVEPAPRRRRRRKRKKLAVSTYHSREKDRRYGRPQKPVTIDIMFPWEATRPIRYDSLGNQMSEWWEVAAVFVGLLAFVAFWIKVAG